LHKCSSKDDPVTKVGTARAKEVRLLCLDEFQVTDIGDALILKRLFETMINNHMILVATSNRPPEDLYKGGL
jgi:protein AFG1